MVAMLQRLLLVSGLSFYVNAHMEMKWPYAFRSKYNPNITDPDYNNISPLNKDGSNYPCRGYVDLPSSQASVTSYIPGQTYNLSLAGSATHGGGSCQISLSYDNGQSFHVIKSMIGGCPLKTNWEFTIPSYAPPSDSAIIAWTWFNLIGNREMYMNCARVSIAGQTVQRYRRTNSKRQTSIENLPENFACNIGNGCTTLEDHEVVFPNPGNIVERGTDLYSPLSGPGYNLTTTPTGSGFSNSSASTASSIIATSTPAPFGNITTTYLSGSTGTGLRNISTLTSTSNTSSAAYTTLTITTTVPTTYYSDATVTATVMVITTTLIALLPSSTTPLGPGAFYTMSTSASTTTSRPTTLATSTVAIMTTLPGTCSLGQFSCNSSTSYSQCMRNADGTTSYMFVGSLASGMQCINGAFVRENAGPCTPDGSLHCDGSRSFYICTNGGLIDMGPVASGTTCQNGVIGIA